jgi:hypothetical protein
LARHGQVDSLKEILVHNEQAQNAGYLPTNASSTA